MERGPAFAGECACEFVAGFGVGGTEREITGRRGVFGNHFERFARLLAGIRDEVHGSGGALRPWQDALAPAFEWFAGGRKRCGIALGCSDQ